MRTQVPDYFGETNLTFETCGHVDENLVPTIMRMRLDEGINVIHTDKSGLQIMAQVSDGQIVSYSACDLHRNPLIVVAGEQKTASNKCPVLVMDLLGKVLTTCLVPNPRWGP